MSNSHAWLLSDLEKTPKNGLKVFSTFACGGGSTMGYKLAGCEVIGANDIDPEMAWHYRLNHHPKYYFLEPIKKLIGRELPEELFNLDILDGSPPCSSFSMAGNREKDWGKEKHFREGQAKQVLDTLFFDFLDLANYLKPKVIVAENVKGLIQGAAKSYAKRIMLRLEEIGYNPQLFLINSANCGVPQSRERVFFIALRKDIAKPKLRLNPKYPWVSCYMATKDLLPPTEIELRSLQLTELQHLLWKETKVGSFFDKAYEKRFNKKDMMFSYVRINPNIPCNTLTANHNNFTHWSEPRKLTLVEFKRLSSFPDDYRVKSDNLGKYLMGMSVPPRMTLAVAKSIILQWLT